MKKAFSIMIAGLLMATTAVNTSAQELDYDLDASNSVVSYEMAEDEELFLISETVETLEDGTIITSRSYSSVNPYLKAASGSGTFKNEKELEFSDGSTPLKYWVKGLFKWDSDKNTATVSNKEYGHGTVSSGSKILNEKKEGDSNQGGFGFGKKYAYLKYSFTYKNSIGAERSASVYLDVNVEGVSKTS